MKYNLNINILGDKLISYRIKWYGYVLRMNEKKIAKKVLKVKVEFSPCQSDIAQFIFRKLK
jgi:hypothetical protein